MELSTLQSENLNFDKVWFMFQETDKKFKEMEAYSKRNEKYTKKRIDALEKLFTGQWGKLIESLIEGDLIKLLNERGIKVQNTSTRVKGVYNKEQFEFDIIAENGDDIVVVEVKTTLRPDDVKHFLDKLSKFKEYLPKYKNNNIFGAMAFLTDDSESAYMTQKKELYAIRATGNSASIINNSEFVPKAW